MKTSRAVWACVDVRKEQPDTRCVDVPGTHACFNVTRYGQDDKTDGPAIRAYTQFVPVNDDCAESARCWLPRECKRSKRCVC